jgi:uridine monophosphate synthetase
MASFFERLEERCAKINSILCVGLDPHRSELTCPENASYEEVAKSAEQFCVNLIQATKEEAVAYKPNAAFFEALGSAGVAALERVMAAIPKECLTIYDCKRGDISTTAEAYAEAAYGVLHADSVTVHPYMGWDSVEPFVRDRTKGVFVLAKTSNKSSNDFQSLPCSNSSQKKGDEHLALFEQVARTCVQWNDKLRGESTSAAHIGLVVGATDAQALARTRKQAPRLWILAPGVGFQGGDLDSAVQAGVRLSDGLGLLVPVSRGISRAKDPKQAAKELREQLNQAREKAVKNAAVAASSSPSKKAKVSSTTEIADHQRKFFALAIRCGVLKFGQFTLKSGRISPYFFNAGLFNTGSAVHDLASCYAQTLVDSNIEFDVLFGPAYKGIPLAATVASTLSSEHQLDVPYCYNRKEEKDHGEGGVIVGAQVKKGTRVLILDDVITAGTAVRESVKLIQSVGGTVVGLIVAIDRQEVVTEGTKMSAVDSVKQEYGFPVISIVSLESLLVYCQTEVEKIDGGKKVLDDIREYRGKYGV